jgi:hypothetical protein
MPTSKEILAGLASISAGTVSLAIAWHVVAAIFVLGLIFGWRPSRRLGATILAIPLLSVGFLAWVYGQVFNGVVFIAFALALAILGLRLPKSCAYYTPFWGRFFGALMILFGWIYPHFGTGRTWPAYLYAAPTGILPCPTLSLVVGFALLANGFLSLAWTWTLVVIGLFYGLFGAFRLGVYMDLFLLVGTLLLAAQSFSSKRQRAAAKANAV